jgi:hypothetical protein
VTLAEAVQLVRLPPDDLLFFVREIGLICPGHGIAQYDGPGGPWFDRADMVALATIIDGIEGIPAELWDAAVRRAARHR